MIDSSQLLLLIIGIVFGLILLLQVWNKFSRDYNNKILLKSVCKNCNHALGIESLNHALNDWNRELQSIKKETKKGEMTVTLRNLDLVCPNCRTINKESDLYKTYRHRKK